MGLLNRNSIIGFMATMILGGSISVHGQPATKLKHYTPGAIWQDNKGVHINAHGGGILYNKGVYYWFGEHKIHGEQGNLAMVGVHCYSSRDLYNWKDEGISLRVAGDTASDIAKGCVIERPKVVYNKKTAKFVMWFHLELRGHGYDAARAGLAISDKVTGPYLFIKSARINSGFMPFYPTDTPDSVKVNCAQPHNESESVFCRDYKNGQMARDMNLFVDDNGKAYHIFSSEENLTLNIAELNNEYTGHTGKFVRVYAGHSTEAPAIFKHNGVYYMIASGTSGWAPNAARWFSAPTIWGPWSYHGNPCVGPGSEITFGGQSTYVLPLAEKKNAYIFMADKWTPKNAIDGRYIWLPIRFKGNNLEITWHTQWNLKQFNKK